MIGLHALSSLFMMDTEEPLALIF